MSHAQHAVLQVAQNDALWPTEAIASNRHCEMIMPVNTIWFSDYDCHAGVSTAKGWLLNPNVKGASKRFEASAKGEVAGSGNTGCESPSVNETAFSFLSGYGKLKLCRLIGVLLLLIYGFAAEVRVEVQMSVILNASVETSIYRSNSVSHAQHAVLQVAQNDALWQTEAIASNRHCEMIMPVNTIWFSDYDCHAGVSTSMSC